MSYTNLQTTHQGISAAANGFLYFTASIPQFSLILLGYELNAATGLYQPNISDSLNVGLYNNRQAAYDGSTHSYGVADIAMQSAAAPPFVGTCTLASGSNQLTIASVTSGAVAVGQTMVATDIPAGTTILSFNSGTGGVGTYNMSANATGTVSTAEAISATSLIVQLSYSSGNFSAGDWLGIAMSGFTSPATYDAGSSYFTSSSTTPSGSITTTVANDAAFAIAACAESLTAPTGGWTNTFTNVANLQGLWYQTVPTPGAVNYATTQTNADFCAVFMPAYYSGASTPPPLMFHRQNRLYFI